MNHSDKERPVTLHFLSNVLKNKRDSSRLKLYVSPKDNLDFEKVEKNWVWRNSVGKSILYGHMQNLVM